MPTVDLYNNNNEVIGQLELRDDIFGLPANPHLLHEVVLYQLAKRRAGTAKTKERAEVRGGGKKPWRQKGTGRARAGTSRSPLWRGGGTIHGPQPRTYDVKVTKKARRLALKMALSQKVSEQQFKVLDDLGLQRIKTKDFAQILDRFQVRKTLVLTSRDDEVMEKSARNIPNVKVLRSEGLNVYDLLNHRTIFLTQDTIEMIEERFGS